MAESEIHRLVRNPIGHTKSLWWANPETKKKFLDKMRNRNPQFKGDSVGNDALHQWVRRHLPKPVKCSICNLDKRLELCNVSRTRNNQTYNRELKNWFYACRKCHMIDDGRMIKSLKQFRPIDYSGRICYNCARQFTRIRKDGSPLWFKDKTDPNKWICDWCFQKEWQRKLRVRKRLAKGGGV